MCDKTRGPRRFQTSGACRRSSFSGDIRRGPAPNALRSAGSWNGCSADCSSHDGCCPSYHRTRKKKKKTGHTLLRICWCLIFFFRHCVWSKNLTLSQAWIKQRPPLWRKHITSQFLDNFQRAVTAKMKLFERQLGEQIWFVTMILATYAASYWNAFQTVLRVRAVPPPRTGWRALGLALFLMNWGTWQGANISVRRHCLRLGSCWNAETFWTHWQNTHRNGKWEVESLDGDGWMRGCHVYSHHLFFSFYFL